MFAVEKKLPWGVILLLGGGFALSDATEQWVYNSGARTFKLLCSPGIVSKEPIPPALCSVDTGGKFTTGVRARIFKRLWSPGIDSKEPVPPAYVAWGAVTITLFLLGS